MCKVSLLLQKCAWKQVGAQCVNKKKKCIKNFEFVYENIIKLSIIIKNVNTINDKDEIE